MLHQPLFDFERQDFVLGIEQTRSELSGPGANLNNDAAVGDADSADDVEDDARITQEMLS